MEVKGTQSSSSRPVLPASFAAAEDGATTVNLTWSDTAADYTEIEIDFSLDELAWTNIGRLAKDVEELAHTGRTASTKYYYRARVKKRFKWSAYVTDDATTEA